MKSRREVSLARGSLAAPPQPVSIRTMTASYTFAYMKGYSPYLSASTMRNVDEFSLVQVKHVDGRSSPSCAIEPVVELADDDVGEKGFTWTAGTRDGTILRGLKRSQSKQPILIHSIRESPFWMRVGQPQVRHERRRVGCGLWS